MNIQQYIQNAGFEQPTTMQTDYLNVKSPHSILLSNTGSGKTMAFFLKLLQMQAENGEVGHTLVLCPTRELAQQVFKNWTSLRTGLKTVLCYGGHSFKNEALQLAESPVVVIGTPGRILDHYSRETPGLAPFSNWIIDEYDKTLEFGFLREITEIFSYSRTLKSIQLVSATVIDALPEFLAPYTFETLNCLGNSTPEISFFSVQAEGHDKLTALASFLSTLKPKPTLIFCTHREASERISEQLKEHGKSNVLFHGGMDQAERERALIKFRNGSENCLVCTDLAARGLDIPDIGYVIHYQFPNNKEEFTHRNGRTARMEKQGEVYLIHSQTEPLPDYVHDFDPKPIQTTGEIGKFKPQEWITVYVTVGRKDKIRKMDIAGFFMKDIGIPAYEVGMIDVHDAHSYVALHKNAYKKHRAEFFKVKIKKVSARVLDCK